MRLLLILTVLLLVPFSPKAQTGAEVLEAVMGAIVVDTTWLELPGWHRDSLPVGSRPTPYGKDSILADPLLVDSMIRSLPPIDPLPDSWFYPSPPPCSVWVPGHWQKGGK